MAVTKSRYASRPLLPDYVQADPDLGLDPWWLHARRRAKLVKTTKSIDQDKELSLELSLPV